MRAGGSQGLDQTGLYQQISVRCWAGRKMRLNVKEVRFNGQFLVRRQWCQQKMAMGVEIRQCLH